MITRSRLRNRFLRKKKQSNESHCVKSVRIQSYSGPHFPTFELNTERYRVSPRIGISPKWGKMRTRITSNTDTFHALSTFKRQKNYCVNLSLKEKKESVFGFLLVCISPHSYWIQRDTSYLFVFVPNTGKYGHFSRSENFFENLEKKNITDNEKFWKTVMPFLQ